MKGGGTSDGRRHDGRRHDDLMMIGSEVMPQVSRSRNMCSVGSALGAVYSAVVSVDKCLPPL